MRTVSRFCALILLIFSSFAMTAQAKMPDPDGRIRAEILDRALAAMETHPPQAADTGKLVIVDYGLHSSKERRVQADKNPATKSIICALQLGGDGEEFFADVRSAHPDHRRNRWNTESVVGLWGERYHLISSSPQGVSKTIAVRLKRNIVPRVADVSVKKGIQHCLRGGG